MRQRVEIAMALLMVEFLFSQMTFSYPMFYFYAAVTDLIILIVFGYCSYSYNSRLIIDLQTLQRIAIIAHGYGFLIYQKYWPPVTYNAAITAITCGQWFRLMWIGSDDGRTQHINRFSVVLHHLFNRQKCLSKKESQ